MAITALVLFQDKALFITTLGGNLEFQNPLSPQKFLTHCSMEAFEQNSIWETMLSRVGAIPIACERSPIGVGTGLWTTKGHLCRKARESED